MVAYILYDYCKNHNTNLCKHFNQIADEMFATPSCSKSIWKIRFDREKSEN
uniref:Uncharacterized protein n=1 Tax=Marseillevirus LCMAC201 TaxID=2506605 RepID=A0A481YWF5_9VIRU|nr:MAG: hypothetical protein LCMAC201_01090 [Marseillevirus LCMAC201]